MAESSFETPFEEFTSLEIWVVKPGGYEMGLVN